MEKNYFQQALSDFTFDMASGGAIRHLTDLGYTAKQIHEHLSFPTPYERVQREMWARLTDTGIILLDEPGHKPQEKVSYVRDYDQYGKASFRRIVEKDDAAIVIFQKEENIKSGESEKLNKLIREGMSDTDTSDTDMPSFMSCDFGIVKYRDSEYFQVLLSVLPDKCREYIEGIPWEKRKVYHKIDERMKAVLLALYEADMYKGTCYFPKTQIRVNIS